MTDKRTLCLLLVIGLIAGCHEAPSESSLVITQTSSVSGTNGKFVEVRSSLTGIDVSHNVVTLHAENVPNATITSNGDLSIGQLKTAINSTQRAELKEYYHNALAIHADGVAMGKTGMLVVGQTIASSAMKSVGGSTGGIDKETDVKSKEAEQSSLKICEDLTNIKLAQDKLAEQLSAFKPYANIVDGNAAAACASDTARSAQT